jgi:hypothetical protein
MARNYSSSSHTLVHLLHVGILHVRLPSSPITCRLSLWYLH